MFVVYDPHNDIEFPANSDLPPNNDTMTPEDLMKVCILGYTVSGPKWPCRISSFFHPKKQIPPTVCKNFTGRNMVKFHPLAWTKVAECSMLDSC